MHKVWMTLGLHMTKPLSYPVASAIEVQRLFLKCAACHILLTLSLPARLLPVRVQAWRNTGRACSLQGQL